MKKITFNLLSLIIAVTITGCIVSDESENYKREEISISDKAEGLEISDISSDVQIISTDADDKISVEYTDSIDGGLYDFEVEEGILKIVKTRTTRYNDESNIVVKLPGKKYKTISVKTTNGNIELYGIEASVYNLNTENGDIEGHLKGKYEDYMVKVKAKNGDSNLQDNIVNKENKIDIEIKNGDVDIQFMEEKSV